MASLQLLPFTGAPTDILVVIEAPYSSRCGSQAPILPRLGGLLYTTGGQFKRVAVSTTWGGCFCGCPCNEGPTNWGLYKPPLIWVNSRTIYSNKPQTDIGNSKRHIFHFQGSLMRAPHHILPGKMDPGRQPEIEAQVCQDAITGA